MAQLTFAILLYLLSVTLGEDCVINNKPEYITRLEELLNDLNCGYSVNDPPSANSSVNLMFNMRSFNFDSNDGVFTAQNMISMTWKDERLKWDPAKYHDISESEVSLYHIWTPYIRLINSANSYDFHNVFSIKCSLKSSGDIRCVIWLTHMATCSAKLTNWPYDVQKCNLEFEIQNSLQTENYTMFSPSISMTLNEYNSEWHITGYKKTILDSNKQLKITFTLEREAPGLAAIVVQPTLILTVLSITTLFLDVKSYLRLSIACFSIFGHYYFLLELAANMPMKNAYPPTILLYYRGSLILTVLIIFFTFFLRAMLKLKLTPHHYIQSCNDFVYNSYSMYFVFPWWYADDSKRYREDWTKFANVVNSAFIFIVVIAYISLYGSLVPKPGPIQY